MATGKVHVSGSSLKLSDPVRHDDYGCRLSSDAAGTKKRKFSPVVWRSEEEEFSLKSRRVTETALSKSDESSSESCLVVDDSDFGSLSRYGDSDFNDIKSEGLYGSTNVEGSDLEEGEVEDERIQARDVLKSRWSSESPEDWRGSGNHCSDSSLVLDKKSVTPESGEVQRQVSEDERSAGINEMEVDSESEDGFYQVEEPISPKKGSINMLQGCRNAFEFEKLNKINEGTYGVVYKARDKKTGEIVALKKVKMVGEREGFPLSALREINILLSFDHPSVVGVKEVVMDDHDNVYMVMEHMEHDLKGLMEVMKQPFSTSEVKCLMLQLLEGVKYLHDNWVLHRDLKTSNILFNNSGELKICDFGMSRQYGSPLKPYTSLVVTLWYRAPEVLLGAKQYTTAIDMWSVGCIMAELLTRDPIFKGKTELDQLEKIFRLLGTPSETTWPGLSKLQGAKPAVNQRYNLLRKKFPAASFTGSAVLSDSGFDLLSRLLTYDPDQRITAEDALNHPWFHEIPLPKSKDFMPTFPARHAKRDL